MASKRMIKHLNNAVVNIERELVSRERNAQYFERMAADGWVSYEGGAEEIRKGSEDLTYTLNAAKGMLDEAKSGYPDSYITIRPIWPRVHERGGTPFSW